jgi:hypothetical protein
MAFPDLVSRTFFLPLFFFTEGALLYVARRVLLIFVYVILID